MVLELALPSKEFHVYSTCSFLYGEGGGLFIALNAILLSALYSAVLVIRLRSPVKPSHQILFFLLASLLTHLVRALGGLLLHRDVPGGICLTNLTLFLQVQQRTNQPTYQSTTSQPTKAQRITGCLKTSCLHNAAEPRCPCQSAAFLAIGNLNQT